MSNLPAWRRVLAVVAHPDDESFGLGGVLHAFAAAGAHVSVLCLTHGEASTLGAGDLGAQRPGEAARAAAVLGVESLRVLDYPDSRLADVPLVTLAGTAEQAATDVDGLVAFGPGGVTGHPDHVTASDSALVAASSLGLPILGWVIPSATAAALNAEFPGAAFEGVEAPDLVVEVDRTTQRRACLRHQSQLSPVLWRRLELSDSAEWLVWMVPGER